jgi:ribosomal protein S18 acetylase RimI-like enzyme
MERNGSSGYDEGMEIRPATADDVPGVLPMVEQIGALHESWDPAKYGRLPNFSERYRRWMIAQAQNPTSVFLVAEHEGRLVGFLIGTTDREIPIYRIEQYGFIHDLWVEERYRNEGIGRQMVTLAIERFKQIGASQVRLETAEPNDIARKLFETCGFRTSAVSMLLEIDR